MLAVPLHGDDVAPRFCSADQFLIADLDLGEVRGITDEAERILFVGVRTLEEVQVLPAEDAREDFDVHEEVGA